MCKELFFNKNVKIPHSIFGLIFTNSAKICIFFFFFYSPLIYSLLLPIIHSMLIIPFTLSKTRASALLFSESLWFSAVVVVCFLPVKEAASAPIDGITAPDFSHPLCCSSVLCWGAVVEPRWVAHGFNKLKAITIKF